MSIIPIVGWLIDLILYTSLAIPFYVFWTLLGVGEKFFYFLPDVYTKIGFGDTIMLFVCLSILVKFSPFSVSASASNNTGDKK